MLAGSNTTTGDTNVEWDIKCMEEVPKGFIKQYFNDYPRLELGFRYGKFKNVASMGYFGERSKFLHPYFQFYGRANLTQTEWNHYMVEDVGIGFDSINAHEPYLKRMFKVLAGHCLWQGRCGEFEWPKRKRSLIAQAVAKQTSTTDRGVADEAYEKIVDRILRSSRGGFSDPMINNNGNDQMSGESRDFKADAMCTDGSCAAGVAAATAHASVSSWAR